MNKTAWNQNGRIYYGWYILILCFLYMALGYAGILSISSVFIVPVTSELGYSRSSFMLVSTIMMLSSVVFAGIYGRWMEKGKIKQLLILNIIFVFLAYSVFASATRLWQFYLCAILLGSGFSSLSTLPVSILLNQWFGEKVKGTVMAIAFTGSGIGGLILTPLINSIIELHGWRQGYFTLGLFFLLVMLPFTMITALVSPEAKGFQIIGQSESSPLAETRRSLTYQQAKRAPYFWIVLAALFLMILGSGALISTSTAYFVECGFSASTSAQFSGYMLGMLAIGKLFCGFLCDRGGVKAGVVGCFGIYGLCFLLLFFLPNNPILIFPIVITFGFGAGAVTIAPPLLVTNLFGEQDYGTILGSLTMSVNISVAVGSFLASTVYDFAHSYTPYWLFSTIGAIVAAFSIYAAFTIKNRMEQT
jgi:MFS family permease